MLQRLETHRETIMASEFGVSVILSVSTTGFTDLFNLANIDDVVLSSDKQRQMARHSIDNAYIDV